MTTPSPGRDYFPYALIGFIAVTLFMLMLLDRRFPVFASYSSMAPLLFIVFAIAIVLTRFTTETEITGTEQRLGELWLPWHRIGIVGGSLNGLIFLATYWAYDWPAPHRFELSERRVHEMCPLVPAIPEHQIQQDLPDPLSLIPSSIFFGLVSGLMISWAFPRWCRLLQTVAAQRPSFSFLARTYPAGLAFGALSGGTLGTIFCTYYFAQTDGRPLMRISTSAVATFLAIGFYMLFEIARHRRVMTAYCYRSLTNVLVIGTLITSFVWLIDSQLNFSEQAYCMFYSGWDTELNQLKRGAGPILSGALYGCVIGAIVMSVAAGYLIIQTILHRGARNPNPRSH